jgi:hypothetical protein
MEFDMDTDEMFKSVCFFAFGLLCALGIWRLSQTPHNCFKDLQDKTPPCFMIDAEADAALITERMNTYYSKEMAVHYLHGTDNGDMVVCFVGGYDGEIKRTNK